MTTTIETGALDKALRTLKLSGMLATIEARLAQARAGELGHIDFLQVLCEDEISRRDTMSITRRLRKARFEEQATLEGFGVLLIFRTADPLGSSPERTGSSAEEIQELLTGVP
jgi:DNA replication protein DnaC